MIETIRIDAIEAKKFKSKQSSELMKNIEKSLSDFYGQAKVEMFFQTPYKEIDRETYDKFSLEGFLYNIFVNPETDYWRKSM